MSVRSRRFVLGFLVGIVASIMGVGGGFFMVPAMIYLIGMPTAVVVGTSLFGIIVISSVSCFAHAVNNNNVDIILGLLLAVGAVIGAQYGTRIGGRIRAEHLRGLLALLVLAVGGRLAYSLVVMPDDPFAVGAAVGQSVMPVLRQIGMAAIAAVVAAQAATHAAAEEGGPDEPLLIALSTQRIEIDSNFAGTSILLFGATDVVGDVVVSVRGPEEPVVVRRKRQTVGVWINQESIAFRNVPGYYFVAASRPLEEIAPAEFLDRKQLGSGRLLLEAIWFDTSGDANEFRAALHRGRERDSLYRSEPGVVEFIDERLFRTTIDLPAHVPTGDYVVEALLMVDGEVLSTRSASLSVEKAGFSADISTFARADEALYGVIAIALALVAGWLGSFAFRKG